MLTARIDDVAGFAEACDEVERIASQLPVRDRQRLESALLRLEGYVVLNIDRGETYRRLARAEPSKISLLDEMVRRLGWKEALEGW